MLVTMEQLQRIAPKYRGMDIDELNRAMGMFKIDTPKRAAAFIAQLCVECIQFTVFEEIWGPSADQVMYERPIVNGVPAPLVELLHIPLWQRLGNTERGDGFRFRGRGAIQITGRFNYTRLMAYFGIDFIAQPELLLLPKWRYVVSGWYWMEHELNPRADDGDFIGITREINGKGMYALRQRQTFYATTLDVLGASPVCGP